MLILAIIVQFVMFKGTQPQPSIILQVTWHQQNCTAINKSVITEFVPLLVAHLDKTPQGSVVAFWMCLIQDSC